MLWKGEECSFRLKIETKDSRELRQMMILTNSYNTAIQRLQEAAKHVGRRSVRREPLVAPAYSQQSLHCRVVLFEAAIRF